MVSYPFLHFLDSPIYAEPYLLEFTQRWIVNDNWTYTADISPLLKETHAPEKKLLVFYGLDTVANIVRDLFRQLILALIAA